MIENPSIVFSPLGNELSCKLKNKKKRYSIQSISRKALNKVYIKMINQFILVESVKNIIFFCTLGGFEHELTICTNYNCFSPGGRILLFRTFHYFNVFGELSIFFFCHCDTFPIFCTLRGGENFPYSSSSNASLALPRL